MDTNFFAGSAMPRRRCSGQPCLAAKVNITQATRPASTVPITVAVAESGAALV